MPDLWSALNKQGEQFAARSTSSHAGICVNRHYNTLDKTRTWERDSLLLIDHKSPQLESTL